MMQPLRTGAAGPTEQTTQPRAPSRGDIVAGLSVAMVAIPQSLAYAELAGLLALLVGVMRLVLGLVRLGNVAYLLLEPVLLGFTTGAAVLILSSQLPRVFDIDTSSGDVLANGVQSLTNPGRWDWAAVAFSVGSAAVIVGGRRIHRLFPGVLVAVIGGVILSTLTGYAGSTVGELKGGFITLGIDFPWRSFSQLIVPALAIALVGFAEPSSIARTLAAEERQPWNANREMISQGVANLAAGVSGAFPVGGSFSRSSLNRLAGATSAWSGAITGAFVLLALPLTPLLADLPQATLGTIIVVAVIKLIKVTELVDLFRQSLPQAAVAVGTLAMTLAFSPRVERGVLVGIGLALAVHLHRELNITVDSELDGATLTLKLKGVLWFATVAQIDRLIRDEVADRAELQVVILDLGGVGRLDYTGASVIRRIITELEATDTDVEITNVPPGARSAAKVHLQQLL